MKKLLAFILALLMTLSLVSCGGSTEQEDKTDLPATDNGTENGTAEIGDGTSHAWFAGYLQSGAPLAFAVVIERGGGGLAQAGAVANTILQTASEIYGK